MSAIHDLKIKSPYEILEIEDIRIENEPNKHGHLYIKCLIDDSNGIKSTLNSKINDEVCVYKVENSTDNNILFDGIIQKVKTSINNGLCYIEVEALSASIILDINKKSRSFQDINMTYNDILKKIFENYPNKSCVFAIENNIKIQKPIFQYQETDWSFIKRLASNLGKYIYSNINDMYNLLFFDISSQCIYELNNLSEYTICKNLQRFRIVNNNIKLCNIDDYVTYTIESKFKYNIGDVFLIKNKSLLNYKYEAFIINEEIIYKYKLCSKNAVWKDQIINESLKGVAIEGEVIDRKNELLKIHFDIDKEQQLETAFWFEFLPPSVNIMYSMPIIGTKVRVYFSNENGNNPIVIGCIRTNSNNCNKITNPANKYYETEHKNEISFLSKSISINENSKLNISLKDDVGFLLTSPSKLKINAGENIKINTKEQIKINAKSKLKITKSNTANGILLDNECNIRGNNVFQNGKS